MTLLRPATPGFLVTLVATILLAVVSFSVPLFKSVFFLEATVSFNGQNGSATFGVLGYCLNAGGHVNCTSPRVGYEFDPNSLLGNTTPIQIPEVIVKWLTYALVLHIVALAFAAGSAVFGLLAHIRELSMVCCSTCISGFGAAIALIAFIFDIAFFFLAKARINKVPGGSARIGNAIWLTLAAWLLLFFAGCFYGFGRCCISSRPRGPRDKDIDPSTNRGFGSGQAEAMRLDAVKAEADRKARQKQGETGLPAFHEYDPSKPLTAKYDEEEEPYSDNHLGRQASAYSGAGGYAPSHTGYTPAPPGTSAMDAYYNPPLPTRSPQPPAAVTGYPPQPPAHVQYPSTQYNAYEDNVQPNHHQYPSSNNYNHEQYPSNAVQEGGYGHQGQDSSYYSAASQYQPPYNPEPSSYNTGGYVPSATPVNPPAATAPAHDYYNTSTAFLGSSAPGSMGRNDYTFSATPPVPTPAPLNTAGSRRQSAGPRGPRTPTSPVAAYNQQTHSDNPPGYEMGNSTNAAWPAEKR
ncbi:pali-domain-containing protein [Ramaria rubella]|nr:pali-domain-containing protein [Ramaria rubella]